MNITKPTESHAFRLAASMPPLSHSVPGQDFDIKNSEAARWMIDQPEILQMLFNYFRQSGAIIFQKENKTWVGINFQNPKNNNHSTGKIPLESSGCGVVQIHSTPPVI